LTQRNIFLILSPTFIFIPTLFFLPIRVSSISLFSQLGRACARCRASTRLHLQVLQGTPQWLSKKWRMPLLSHSSRLPDTIHTCHVTNVRIRAFFMQASPHFAPFYPIGGLILRCLQLKTVPTPK
jgi:hypothetical protein